MTSTPCVKKCEILAPFRGWILSVYQYSEMQNLTHHLTGRLCLYPRVKGGGGIASQLRPLDGS
jgi:hypothetical protein